jgi:uncharacterized membrane protein YqaE (UPF0057 family)
MFFTLEKLGGRIAQNSRANQPSHIMKILLIILCFFIPPLAVYLKTNDVKTTLINLVLSIFFWVPGVIHALYVVLTAA